MKKLNRKFLILGIVLTFVLGYMAGSVRSDNAWASPKDIYSKLDVFAKVLHYVETNYVDKVDEQELVYGAIKGMLDTLDPHTVFMPPDVYREMKIDTTGEFQGLGIIVEIRDDRLAVVRPITGTPAHKAGLKSGDIIVKIDNNDTKGMSLQDAIRLMRGPIGSQIVLSILRGQSSDPLVFQIRRDRVRIASVEHRLIDQGIGYIHVKQFQDNTTNQMVAAMQKMSLENGGPLTGLVLDLRDNPGGLLDEAVKMVDEFVSKGLIVTTEGQNHSHIDVEKAHSFGNYLKNRMAVLINGQSASAAEIVAGALKDHKRSIIIGTKSFGKGSVQNIIELEDGSGLKITVAKYYTPNRVKIDSIGIIPDVTVVQPRKLASIVAAGEDSLPSLPQMITDKKGQKLLKLAESKQLLKDESDQQLKAAYAYLVNGKLP